MYFRDDLPEISPYKHFDIYMYISIRSYGSNDRAR